MLFEIKWSGIKQREIAFSQGDLFGLFALFLLLLLPGCSFRGHDNCPLILAHRAGAREVGLNDNSSTAMRRAVQDRLPVLEVDLRFSRDGEPFLFHDSRFIDRAWKIPVILANKRFSMTDSNRIRSVCSQTDADTCVLHLSNALEIMRQSKATLQLDLKGDLSDEQIAKIAEMVKSSGVSHQAIFFCDPVSELIRVQTMAPNFRIIGRAYTEQELKELLPLRPYGVQVDEELLDSKGVKELREEGVLVMVKTLDSLVDTAEHWRRLARSAVDIILTDYPRAARAELCSR